MTLPKLEDIAAALDCPGVLTATVMDGGQNNLVLDTGRLIVRIARHRQAQDELRREAAVLAALAGRLPLPIPAMTIRRVGSEIVSVHPRLPGEALSSIGDFADAKRAAGDLARFLQALHACPAETLAGLVDTGETLSTWHGLFDRARAKLFPLLPRQKTNDIASDFETYLAGATSLPQTVIHGDFGTGNVLVGHGEVTAIIDFAGCSVGDPAYDLASLLAGLGNEFLPLIAARYPAMAGMQDRIAFYRRVFPLEEALFGVENNDRQALQAGLERL